MTPRRGDADRLGGLCVAGLDIGSVATKAVVCDVDGHARGHGVAPTGWQARGAALQALEQAFESSPLDRAGMAGFGVTGYGRELLPGALCRATEVTCQARGVRHACPGARTILDIGGQDSKVIWLDPDGNVEEFALNDRCAAGTGRFLEVMARALDMPLDYLGRAACAAARPSLLSSTCTVFAESEVVGLLARGEARDSIAAGLCQAVARQMVALGSRVGLQPPVCLVGGVAQNQGVVAALNGELEYEVTVPPNPQFTAALGAALLALEALDSEGAG